jgi:hypothetical protein
VPWTPGAAAAGPGQPGAPAGAAPGRQGPAAAGATRKPAQGR